MQQVVKYEIRKLFSKEERLGTLLTQSMYGLVNKEQVTLQSNISCLKNAQITLNSQDTQ